VKKLIVILIIVAIGAIVAKQLMGES